MKKFTPGTVLIALIFGAASVLAWQAYESAKSHRQASERVLQDYVQFAGWEFVRVVEAGLHDMVTQWSQPVCGPGGVLLTPAEFNARPACKCNDVRAVTIFRQSPGQVDTTGEALTASARAWLASLDANEAGHSEHRAHAMHVETVGGVARIAVAKSSGTPGTPGRVTQGFVMNAAPVQHAIRDAATKRPLLPATLAGTKNELLAINVRTPDGTTLYSSGGTAGSAKIEGRLAESLGGLAYEVVLEPEAAGRLVIGGLPRSRLPLVLTLLAITGALAVAAVLQLRREHQLASMRSDFVSSVSHELRTPLAQIRLFSETLLLNRVRSEGEGRRSLEIIQQESRRLAHLVDNVLCFSRSERGVERVSLRPVPLAPLVSELVEGFAPLARSGRSHVRLDVRESIDALVDPHAFKQILLNLLDNAVKYGRQDQTIVVTVGREDGRAIVTVSDEGPGIPPESRARIFAPYWRLVTASSSAVAGTGIGLAVVRELVRLHDGSVRVDDAPRGGACFVVELRAAPNHSAEDTALAPRSLTA
jgi:signal transduction histidine kinase